MKKALLFVIGLVSLVFSCDLYTVAVDNSSLQVVGSSVLLFNDSSNYSFVSSYTSFRQDCYPGSSDSRPNKITIRVFPSYPLFKQYRNVKGVLKHVDGLFVEINKIFVNQLNILLIPNVIMPKKKDPPPINGGINVLGDLNTFGNYVRTMKGKAEYNLFLANNYEGIVGASYIGVVGSKNFNYGVSQSVHSICSHELLHGFGAQHTFGKGGVMDYAGRLINGILQMHPDNKPQVCGFLNYYFRNN